MIRGRAVTVHIPAPGAPDPFNATPPTFEDIEVEDVLWDVPATSEPTEGNRPDAVRSDLRVHFPKTFTAPLMGAEVTVEGVRYRVIGNPRPLIAENTPTRWNLTADLEATNG